MATKMTAKSATKAAPMAYRAKRQAAAPTGAAQPDTEEQIRAEAQALALRWRALRPAKITASQATEHQKKTGHAVKPDLGPAIVATKGQVKMISRMVDIDSEIASLPGYAALVAERSRIKAELDEIVDAAQAEAITAESVGLKYTAESHSGGVSVTAPKITHHVRKL